MRVLYIVGSMTKKDGWRTASRKLGELLESDLHEYDFGEFEHYYAHYTPSKLETVQSVITEVTELCSDGKPTILLAHSLGGVVAHAVAQADSSNIVKIVCIHSPIRISEFWNVDTSKTAVPVLEIAGKYDPLVYKSITSIDGQAPITLPTDHVYGYVYSDSLRGDLVEKIINFIKN